MHVWLLMLKGQHAGAVDKVAACGTLAISCVVSPVPRCHGFVFHVTACSMLHCRALSWVAKTAKACPPSPPRVHPDSTKQLHYDCWGHFRHTPHPFDTLWHCISLSPHLQASLPPSCAHQHVTLAARLSAAPLQQQPCGPRAPVTTRSAQHTSLVLLTALQGCQHLHKLLTVQGDTHCTHKHMHTSANMHRATGVWVDCLPR